MSPTRTTIYEPLYADGQELQNPDFIGLRVSNERPDWREFGILVQMYRDGLHRNSRITGLLSPKFSRKTGLSGASFLNYIETNPSADVYTANPWAYAHVIHFNIWEQGEDSHPGLIKAAQALLNAALVPYEIAEQPRHAKDVLTFCNYWAACEAFWDEYVGGILLPIAEFLEANPSSPVTRNILDYTWHNTPAPFLPFMIERMFTTHLSGNRKWRIAAWQRDPMESAFTPMQRELIDLLEPDVKRADEEGVFSPELRRLLKMATVADRVFTTQYYALTPHPYK